MLKLFQVALIVTLLNVVAWSMPVRDVRSAADELVLQMKRSMRLTQKILMHNNSGNNDLDQDILIDTIDTKELVSALKGVAAREKELSIALTIQETQNVTLCNLAENASIPCISHKLKELSLKHSTRDILRDIVDLLPAQTNNGADGHFCHYVDCTLQCHASGSDTFICQHLHVIDVDCNKEAAQC